jgi:hypothetical protein
VLKNVGWSFQTAAGVAAHRHEAHRQAWRPTPWRQSLRAAHAKHAWRRFGDAARCPPWGTLTDPWARRGPHPTGQTSGKRTGSKGLGLMDVFRGGCLSHGPAGRRNSTADRASLTRVLQHPTHHLLWSQEGAKSPTSAETHAFFAQRPARRQGVQRPASSPDYHPLAKRWKQRKPPDTHRQDVPTCEALTEKVEQALLKFAHAPEEVLARCGLPTELAQAA